MLITSLTNKQVKYACSLKEKKFRDLENKYLIEGEHLIEMANPSDIECLFTTDLEFKASYPVIYITQPILEKLSFTKNPQNKIAILKKKVQTLSYDKKHYLLLDNVSDPGNVGSIIRSALAFHIDYVVLSKNSVDIYNEKVIRGSQGAFIKVPIVYANLNEVILKLQENKIPVYASCLSNDTIDLKNIESTDSFALIVGNEGQGISKEIIDLADKSIKIEHSDAIDSLNVSVATAIMLYNLLKK